MKLLLVRATNTPWTSNYWSSSIFTGKIFLSFCYFYVELCFCLFACLSSTNHQQFHADGSEAGVGLFR